MSLVLKALQYAVSVAFIGLGVLTVRDWLSGRDRRRGYLALALGLLGVVAVTGQLQALVGYNSEILTIVSLAAFQGSAFGLLMFRHSFIPYHRPVLLATFALLVAAAGLDIALSPPADPAADATQAQMIATLALILVWVSCVAEPSIRFWIASRQLPAVQRRRLQAISLGYFGIAAILVLAGGAGSKNQTVNVIVEALAVLVAPLLYVSFAPPRWVRRAWREPEEARFRAAINDLLLFAPDRGTLAERALDWGVRLVGAGQGLIEDGDGEILAAHGLDAESGRAIAKAASEAGDPQTRGAGAIISVPLHLDTGQGHLIVVAGPYTPLFGSDEVSRLHQYAPSIAAALDRVRVAERLAALEEVKSRFLRLASHELRGPLTLVRGYVSMIGDGSLTGDNLQRAVPVMLAKLSQMTNMLSEMLDTARLEDDRLDVKLERFDLRSTVSEVVEQVQPLTGDSHALDTEVPPVEIAVVADRAKVETIVSNLVENAIKYSPNGGRVRLILGTSHGSAMLAVSDEGIGISKEDLKTLFTRFGRITNDDTISIPGTGLGLYVSRELARVQSGDVTAASEIGRGSTFTLRLPLAT